MLLALVAAVHAPVVFGGKSYAPSGLQPHGLVDGAAYGYEGRTPVNTFNVDLSTPAWYEWPVNRTVGDIYRSGELPLWNPYQGAGAPLAADYSTRAFFPYQVIEDLAPPAWWDFFMLGRPLVAGLFTFLFLSTLGLAFPAAMAGAVLYIFSGVFTWFINLEQMTNVAMALPVLVYSAELLAGRGTARRVAFAGASVALVVLGGQPEVAFYALALGASWFVFRVLSLHRGEPKTAVFSTLKAIGALAVGLALSSPLILPFIEYVEAGFTLHHGGAGVGVEFVSNWKKFIGVVVPAATALPADPAALPGVLFEGEGGNFYRLFATKGSWDYLGGYTGVVALFLAACGVVLPLAGGRGGREGASGRPGLLGAAIFLTAFAAIVILKNFGVRPFLWLGHLPLFERVWSPRWAGPAWVFALASAGALGVEAVSSAGAVRARRALGWVFVISVLLYAAFPLAGALNAAVNREAFGPVTAPYVAPAVLVSTIAGLVFLVLAFLFARGAAARGGAGSAMVVLMAAELWWAVPRGYGEAWLYLKPLPLAAALAAAVFIYLGARRAAPAAAAVFVVSFLAIDLSAPAGLPGRHDPFAEPPYVRLLRERGPEGFRVMGGYGVMMPNYAGAVGFADLRHINALLPPSFWTIRYGRLTTPVEGEDTESGSLWFTGLSKHVVVRRSKEAGLYFATVARGIEEDIKAHLPWYSIMGVRYILMPSWFGREGPGGGESGGGLDLPLVYDDEVRVFENPGAMPRAFVVYPDVGGSSLADYLGPGGGVTPAVIREYTANTVTIEAAAGEGGKGGRALLVLTDLFWPGWEARVDGKAAGVYVVGGAFRGVFLTEGAHTVEFRYRPRSFSVGMVLFFGGALAAIALAVPWRRLRVHRPGGRDGA